MRYIDPQLVSPHLPNEWVQQAVQATKALATAQPHHRSAQVNARNQVWKDVKEILKSASQGKCWYCESLEIRSDNAVDHFRPKNAVAECPGHEGYWWLAFKWENYRFCCTFCNSRRIDQMTGQGGGKVDHFPLKDELHRAKTPNDNLDDEEPMLLDPCSPADPGLLWFDETGQATPNPVCGDPTSYPVQRAVASIGFYHLNHSGVVDQRKVVCSEIRNRVADADRYFIKYMNGDGTARAAFAGVVSELKSKLATSARYSATARAMLMGLRGKHPFVDMVLAST